MHPAGRAAAAPAGSRRATVDGPAGARRRAGRRPRPATPPVTASATGLHSLPWDGLKLSRGEPAIRDADGRASP